VSGQQIRVPDYPINPLFIDRWSRRSFTGEEIGDEAIFTLFEAARWAPSAMNSQPWRFIYSKRGDASWDVFLDLLSERNRAWAQKAAVIVVIVSTQNFDYKGTPVPLNNASLDTGAAWASLAFQAQFSQLSTRAIGGFDRDKARQVLKVPEGYVVEVAVAIGRPGPVDLLPDEFRAQETPSSRNPLKHTVAHGEFIWDS